jgi:superfamily II DNA or RNA helicase
MHKLPEPGQLVRIRQRLWSVSEVEDSVTPTGHQREQHLVSLVSVEEDSFDESLRVIWEIEPAAQVLDTGGLPAPEGFDPPEVQKALLDAVRWGSVTNADVDSLLAPFRSGIEIEDYQLDPVVRALSMPRTNLLLADDVGLGKTIEAGLVLQELLLRHRARTCLIICPASLQIKWQDEMREKFGLEFRILDSEAVREIRRSRGLHVNAFSHFPRLIVSIDWIKRPGPLKSFTDTVPQTPTIPRKYDVLIVDEAHNVAPTATRNYVHESDRTRAIRRIGPHFEHRLFLTATPHNGYTLSFNSMLELLDDRRFARGVDIDPAQLAAVMIRRLKSDIVNEDGSPRFPKREIIPLLVDYKDSDSHIHELLKSYTTLRRSRSKGEGRNYASEFVLQLLKKRLFSSPAAFAATLEKHIESRTNPRQPKSKNRKGEPLQILKRMIAETEEETADDNEFEESLDAVVITAGLSDGEISGDEQELLNQMKAWSNRNRSIPDSRAIALINWLRERLKPDGQWNDQRVIIFTEYRATQNWIIDVLTAAGLGDADRLMMLYGGMDGDQREKIKAAFQSSPDVSPVRVLVATDAASEGIDLQNHCSLMVHLEIPWNPNRLEQRNGRIDRHGQKADAVEILHFLPKDVDLSTAETSNPGKIDGDAEFLFRAAIKIDSIRHDLGSVGPVLADQINEAMFGERSNIDTASAERSAAAARSVLRVERDVRERLARLRDRLDESRANLGVDPKSIKNMVDIGLELADRPPLGVVSGSEDEFRVPILTGSWAKASEGLEHPHTRVVRPITFDPDVIRGRDDVVLLHLSHPLAELSQRLLRAELWAPESQRRLQRYSVRLVDSNQLDGIGVVAHSRLVVVGDRGVRLHEEVTECGGLVRNNRFARSTIGDVRNLFDLDFQSPDRADDLTQIQSLWDGFGDQVRATIDWRSRTRMETLTNTISRKGDSEVEEVNAVFLRLRQSIEDALKDPINVQMELWNDDERTERRRYSDSLQLKLERLPSELKREIATVRSRYASPVSFTFPISVTLFLPEDRT